MRFRKIPVEIEAHEAGHRVCPGDWIITGVKGDRYPCKPDIFFMTYAKVDYAESRVGSR